ncbi:hypothetical protein RCL_jg21032.t1 [Rhizophagus clarus]|uniref:Uncharacterized protein n=1 Tax=Rhizophagus clarus TaxID=94130 RepID=A0A8H3MGH6_9GLOM|nr:hypothetical protein RCL_jg21032.t1 [Rhizophagus clarus]
MSSQDLDKEQGIRKKGSLIKHWQPSQPQYQQPQSHGRNNLNSCNTPISTTATTSISSTATTSISTTATILTPNSTSVAATTSTISISMAATTSISMASTTSTISTSSISMVRNHLNLQWPSTTSTISIFNGRTPPQSQRPQQPQQNLNLANGRNHLYLNGSTSWHTSQHQQPSMAIQHHKQYQWSQSPSQQPQQYLPQLPPQPPQQIDDEEKIGDL